MIEKYLKPIVACIIFTIILLQFENKSNFNSIIIIPIIVSLLVKYLFGDWDDGYVWSISDIYYWGILLFTSIFIISILPKK